MAGCSECYGYYEYCNTAGECVHKGLFPMNVSESMGVAAMVIG